MNERGVRFGADGALARRALDRLTEGPCEAAELAREALGLRGGPPSVAARLVDQLLRDVPEAEATREGRRIMWRLADEAARRMPSAGPPRAADGRPAAAGVPEPVAGRPLSEMRFAVVDVETNGLVAGSGGRIVEIAIVDVAGGAVGGCFSTLVDADVAIPPFITRLTGIRTEMTRGAPRFSQICGQVRARLGGRVFVAHNAGYDWGFVSHELRRAGATVPRGPRLCTIHMARRLLPGLERRGLDAVADYYGIEIPERHRARGDAVATARVLVRLLADAERRGWTTWSGLKRGLGPPPRSKRRKRKEGGDGRKR